MNRRPEIEQKQACATILLTAINGLFTNSKLQYFSILTNLTFSYFQCRKQNYYILIKLRTYYNAKDVLF